MTLGREDSKRAGREGKKRGVVPDAPEGFLMRATARRGSAPLCFASVSGAPPSVGDAAVVTLDAPLLVTISVNGGKSLGKILDAFTQVEMRHVYAGALARTLSQVFIHPIDTIKTRKQAHIAQRVVKGVMGITRDCYLGLGASIAGTLPTAMSYFLAYETVKTLLEGSISDEKAWKDTVIHLSCASTGAVISSVFRVPGDTIKHRVQAYKHANARDALAAVTKAGGGPGLIGLYSGVRPTIIRDVAETAVQFALYEYMRRQLVGGGGAEAGEEGKAGKKKKKLSTWVHLCLGGASGAISAGISMPLDVIKTRIQIQGGRETSIFIVGAKMFRENPTSLYSGLQMRVLQTATMSAMFFACFEAFKLVLKPDREPEDKSLLPKLLKKKREKVWKRQFGWR